MPVDQEYWIIFQATNRQNLRTYEPGTYEPGTYKPATYEINFL
jgi:hypothetical protein